MKISTVVVFLAISASSCAAPPPTPGKGAPPKSDTAPVIASVEHTGMSPISQTLTPDAHGVSILFDNLQASADSHKIGAAQIGDVLAISIKGGGVARVSIDARGSLDGNEGDCEVSLTTPSGGNRYWAAGGGAYVLNLTADVQLPFVFKVAVHGLCWSKPVEGGFALVSVDSLDVTIEQRPDAVAKNRSR